MPSLALGLLVKRCFLLVGGKAEGRGREGGREGGVEGLGIGDQ